MLGGHEGEVTAIAFAPDGKLVVTASWDATVKLWDVNTGQECGLLRGHKGAITAIAFSPDGGLIATGSWDKLVILWDLVSGKVKGVIRGHEKMVTSLAFAPDGRTLASGSWDKSAKVWDAESGRELLDFPATGLPSAPWPLPPTAVDRDRKLGCDRPALGRGDRHGIRSFKGHAESVRAVAFSPNGDMLATGGWDGTARVWSVETGVELATFKGHGEKVNAVAFAPRCRRRGRRGEHRRRRGVDADSGGVIGEIEFSVASCSAASQQ